MAAAAVNAAAISAVVLLASMATGFVWLRRRKLRQQQEPLHAPPADQAEGMYKESHATSSSGRSPSSTAGGVDDGCDVEKGVKRPAEGGEAGGIRKGWNVMTSLTCPSVGQVKDNSIEFGACRCQ